MRMKRFLAGFLCLCMVGTMDMPYVQAAAVAAKSEPVAQESAKQDAEDAKPSEDVENQDNDQRSEAAKQTEVVTDTQAAEQAESAGSTENKTEQTALLNYALIDQPTVEMPGTQNVLLSIGDEHTVIERQCWIMSTRQQERHIRYRQLRSVRMRCCLRWSFRKVPRQELTVW